MNIASNLRDMMDKVVGAAQDAALGVESPVMANLNRPASKMMVALMAKSERQGFPIYAGTANRNAVAKRHARNKVARRSRALNRG